MLIKDKWCIKLTGSNPLIFDIREQTYGTIPSTELELKVCGLQIWVEVLYKEITAMSFLWNKQYRTLSDTRWQIELLPGFVLEALIHYTLIKTVSGCQQPRTWLVLQPIWDFLAAMMPNWEKKLFMWNSSILEDFSLMIMLLRLWFVLFFLIQISNTQQINLFEWITDKPFRWCSKCSLTSNGFWTANMLSRCLPCVTCMYTQKWSNHVYSQTFRHCMHVSFSKRCVL